MMNVQPARSVVMMVVERPVSKYQVDLIHFILIRTTEVSTPITKSNTTRTDISVRNSLIRLGINCKFEAITLFKIDSDYFGFAKCGK